MAISPSFLINVANLECENTRDIYANILKVSSICQVIYALFRLKARPWQVNILIDIYQK